MFARRKKNYRTFIYAALIVTLCLLIIALLWPKDAPADGKEVKVSTDTEVSDNEKTNNDEVTKPKKNIDTESPVDDKQNTDISDQGGSYYLVRKDGENISVYFVDEKGNEVKLEATDILYEFLPPDDQLAFEKGVKVNSQEELAALLQDFES